MRMRLSDSKITRWVSGKRAWLWGEKSELSSLVCYFGFYSLFDVYFSYDILFQCLLLYSTWVVFYSQFFSLTATSHTLEEVYRSPPVFLTCAARLQKQVSCTIGSHSTKHGELQNRFSYFPFPLLLLFFVFVTHTKLFSHDSGYQFLYALSRLNDQGSCHADSRNVRAKFKIYRNTFLTFSLP